MCYVAWKRLLGDKKHFRHTKTLCLFPIAKRMNSIIPPVFGLPVQYSVN